MSFLSQHKGKVFGYGTRQCQVGIPHSCPSASPSPKMPAALLNTSCCQQHPSLHPLPLPAPLLLPANSPCVLLLFALQRASFSVWEQHWFAAACSRLCLQPCKELSVLAAPACAAQELTAPGPGPAAASSPAPTQPTSTEPTRAHGSNARDKKTLHLPAVTFTAGLPHTAPHGPPPQAHCSVIPTHSDPPGQTKTLPWCSGHSGAFLQFLLILLLSEVHFEPWLPG